MNFPLDTITIPLYCTRMTKADTPRGPVVGYGLVPLILKCRCGYRLRVNAPAGEAPGTVRFRFASHRGTARAWYETDAEPAEYVTQCPACTRFMSTSLLRIRPGAEMCSDACTNATSGTCKCQCGGINHGMAQ